LPELSEYLIRVLPQRRNARRITMELATGEPEGMSEDTGQTLSPFGR